MQTDGQVVHIGAFSKFSLSLPLTTIFLFLLSSVISFNIDTNFPLVYEDPQGFPEGTRANHFGYTVVLYADNNISWIQISSPRANDSIHPEILEPGLIYRCNIGDTCSSYVYDNQGNERHEDYHDRKDQQWLGGSMVIDSDLDLLAVCAPRWVNQIDREERLVEGVCYTSPASNDNYEAADAYKNLPLIDSRYMIYRERDWSGPIYYYGLGQAGMSAFFSKDKNTKRTELILGAPGVFNWQGSVVLLKDSGRLPGIISKREIRTGAMGNKIIPKVSFNLREAPYFGYSVAAGYFFSNELLYVASAPRGNQNRGQVMVFRFPKESGENIREVQKLYFTDEVGGYFGAHLAVGDLNNDGYDDLLVSAPMLKNPTVFIYNGGPRGSLLVPKSGVKELVGSNKLGGNSRFGLCVVVADLDFDSYKEVLVGAPFADDGRGAIALWQGGPSGLKINTDSGSPTVIYYASTLYPYLRGFGISIARPVDIDRNFYPDLAIGSFLSGHAVILRGRPVVKLKIDIEKSKIKKLLHDSKEFLVPYCISYQSPTNLTAAIKVELIVSIDDAFKRAFLKGQPKNYVFINDNVFKFNKTLKTIDPNCQDLNILLKKRIMNYLDPIDISINASIIEYTKGTQVILIPGDNVKAKDHFNNMYPIAGVGSDKYEAPFETDCGSDDVCETDLIVDVTNEGSSNKFIVGSSGTTQIKITVRNKAENSYMTRVKLILPSPTALARLPTSCTIKVDSTILCDLENPLKTNRSKSITLEIDMHDVSMGQNGQYLTFVAEALTSSKEINPTDNRFEFNLFLAVEASLRIFGKSSEDEFLYEKTEDDRVSRELVKFLHLYEIQKFGASPVEEVLLKIRIPYGYQTKKGIINFIKIYIPEGYHDGQPYLCEKNDMIKPMNADEDINNEPFERVVTRKKRQLSESFTKNYLISTINPDDKRPNIQEVLERSKRFLTVQENKNISMNTNLRENRTVKISCEQDEVICTEIICNIGPFRKLEIVSRLLITMKADISAIKNPVMGAKDILIITTDGTAVISDITLDATAVTNISSVFVSSLPGLKVALWLIIVSIVLGLLLLTLLIYGLMRAGFFERKKKDQLKALKEAEGNENEEVPDWYEESLPDEDCKFEIDEKDMR